MQANPSRFVMPECPRCGALMRFDDETTKVREFACATCHNRTIEFKAA
jgi:DNA-directed RNA polymerase subunit RPC12/RpoP